ncbi:AI-2E family transporter [Promicromonospora kroppenstedtii]|uniref:AI-2E family transporter n=1 Tax=Promicromonospora kroppenstedtii TaxID=440482 RepID=UPI00056417BD
MLAALSSSFTLVFLLIMRTPYALPLAVFVGVVSQFVPTIGTYLGGALPVAVALTSQGLPDRVAHAAGPRQVARGRRRHRRASSWGEDGALGKQRAAGASR